MKRVLNWGIKSLAQKEYRRFVGGAGNLQNEQNRILMELIQHNVDTSFGKRFNFAQMKNVHDFRDSVPIADYDGFSNDISAISAGNQGILTADPVRMLEPTSGSASATKYIPYTDGLRQDFIRGVRPWLYDLYHHYPGLMDGSAYWSISPVSDHPAETSGGIPIGFDTDVGYFGQLEALMLQGLFPVGGNTKLIRNMDDFKYYTILKLLRCRDLSLISVWNPSFMMLLMSAATTHQESLLQDLQNGTIHMPSGNTVPAGLSKCSPLPLAQCRHIATALDHGRLQYKAIWPKLQLISCWNEASARNDFERLAPSCDGIAIQGKGLLATEGIVTFPLEGIGKVLAYRSHYYEFIDMESGRVCSAWELEGGSVYSVVLTTSGGLYRYRLWDRVSVDGFWMDLPLLRFLGKEQNVSDLQGEKLHPEHVQQVLDRLPVDVGFRFIAPCGSAHTSGYCLFICPLTHTDTASLADTVEQGLCENHHYRYARSLGQLAPLRVYLMDPGEEAAYYTLRAEMQNARLGDIKPPVLDHFSHWQNKLKGRMAPMEAP